MGLQDPIPKENPDILTVIGSQKLPPYEVHAALSAHVQTVMDA
jgi:hypothetical protein